MASVYRHSSGKYWVAAVVVPGTRKRVVRYAATEREARRLARELERHIGAKALAPPSRLTVATWWATWLARKAAELRPSTVRVYRQTAGRLCAELARVRLDRLSPQAVALALDRLRAAGMGSRARQQAFVYFGACLRAAVREGLLPANPLERVSKPKHEARARAEWSPAEAVRFLAACDRSPLRYAPLCALALLTGMRRGELVGLTWSDVDLAGRVVWVRRQRVTVGGVPATGPLKTKAARRAVPLSDRAVAVLTRQWARTPPAWRGPETPVFCTEQGTPPHPDNLKRTLKTLCREATVPEVSLHQLRHVFTSLALAGGVDVTTLARVLGHTRPSTSLDIYSYAISPERVGEAVDAALDERRTAGGAGGVQAQAQAERSLPDR